MSPELAAEINELLTQLDEESKGNRKLRKELEKVNDKFAKWGDAYGVEIQRVNWNS